MQDENHSKSTLLKRVIVGIHGVAWLIFFHISFDLSGLYYALTEMMFSQSTFYFDEAFVLIPFILTLFYWNSQFLIPRFVTPKYWLKYIIYLFLSYFICTSLSLLIFYLLEESGWWFQVDLEEFEDIIYTLYLIVILASIGKGITKIALDNAHKAKEAKQKHKEAELNYLQAQVNPHFIFNTLNTLYALSEEEGANKTSNAILKFSEIMRYPIHQGYMSSVSLREELTFIDDFIDLQRLKLGEDYPIEFLKQGEFNHIHIMPLCLIPIVENAFKYGVSQRYKPTITFKIVDLGQQICFESENEINTSNSNESHKIGIENLRQRLELYYKEMSSFIISKEKNKFKVKLILPISKIKNDRFN